MDFKTLAKFILALGVIIAAYGGYQYAANLPEKFDPAKSEKWILGGRDDIGNLLGVQNRNMSKPAKRQSATEIMMGGALVLFVGIGVLVAARKKEAAQSQTKNPGV